MHNASDDKKKRGRMHQAADIDTNQRYCPSQVLALAVVERTILDAVGESLCTAAHKRAAIAAIMDAGAEPQSFGWWAHHAFSNPEAAIQKIQRMVSEGNLPRNYGKTYKTVRK